MSNKQSSIDKDFVPYEESLSLKELGFAEPCFGWYQSSRLKKEYRPLKNSGNQSYMRKEDCNAPTFSQAFRWFREKYKRFSHLDQNAYGKYYYDIHNRGKIFFDEEYFECCEEAELACLRKLIEIQEPINEH